ncbi:protoporphyrinogen oxidase [bacterium]|nr:protoporphyrinogen oxidase [bacterium]
MSRPRVVVVGGGVSGLACAHRLARSGEVDVRLLESAPRTGGVVATTLLEDRVLEEGPDSFLTTKPWARELACELGLESELVPTDAALRRSFVLARGKLEPVPEGFHLLAPTSLAPFLRSPIFSLRGKLRAALDLLLPRRDGADESLESFVSRRLGREVFLRLAEPMVAGIYTADPATLSLRATMPQFLDMEAEHGSVIRALWARRRTKEAARAHEASGARYALFLTFRGGFATLTDALAARLPAGTVSLGVEARGARREAAGFRVLTSSEEILADALVVAVPAPRAAPLLREVDAELSRLLGMIPHASVATVNVLLRREQVSHPLDGMGFVVPSREGRFVLACSFSSRKFPGRAREGEVLLRAFVGGARHEERVELPQDEIARRVLADLRDVLGIAGEPLRVLVSRFPGSMPQYLLGHLERVAAIEERARRVPGLALAGNSYRGVGVPDCVRSGEEAARSVLRQLAPAP